MKTFYLLFLTLCLSNVAYSQEYLPVIDTSKTWYAQLEVVDASGGAALLFDGDTLINEQLYVKWYARYCDELFLLGYMRTDSSNAKLWFIEKDAVEERLIMDMNLEVGDAFSFIDADDEINEAEVIAVDTIQGRKHIHFDYSVEMCLNSGFPDAKKLTFVEGIGPSSLFWENKVLPLAFLEAPCVFLAVVHQADTLLYATQMMADFCGGYCTVECFMVSVEDTEKHSMVAIYPNPARHQLYVSTEQEVLKNMCLYDMNGQLVAFQSIEGTSGSIGVDLLPKGIYLLQIESQKGELVWQKVILD